MGSLPQRRRGAQASGGAWVTSWPISSAGRDLSYLWWAAPSGTCPCFLALLRHSLGCKSLLSLKAHHNRKTSLPPLCLETHDRAGRAHLDSQSVLGHEVWWRWSSCHQKPRLLLRLCVSKWRQWLLPAHPGSAWGQSNLGVPGLSLLGCDHPGSSAQCDIEWVGPERPLSLDWGEQQGACGKPAATREVSLHFLSLI